MAELSDREEEVREGTIALVDREQDATTCCTVHLHSNLIIRSVSQ